MLLIIRGNVYKKVYNGAVMNNLMNKMLAVNCQKYKLTGRGYGLLPEREVQISPWEEVAIDLIGTWEVKVNG